jgi:CRP/FNR family nitrogen fixation transcriptional regulator
MLIQTKISASSPAPHLTCLPEAAAVVQQALPCPVSFYARDQVIYAQGEAVGPLYLVEFGTVRIVRLTADGRRQINAFHFAGEVFGFEASAEHQCYAESVDGVGIRVLRPSGGQGFGVQALQLALKAMERAQHHALMLGRMNATERFAAFLLDLAQRQDSDRVVGLPMQRNDIADYLGLTFETVSRVLRHFKDRHIIRLAAVDEIEVMNFDALEDCAG